MGFVKKALNILGINSEIDEQGVDDKVSTSSKKTTKTTRTTDRTSRKSSSPLTVDSVDNFLSKISDLTGYDIYFEHKPEADVTTYEIKGEEVEDFLGQDAELLEALGHLTMRVKRKIYDNQKTDEEADNGERVDLRVLFDSEGFREKRANELRDLARKTKEKVLSNEGRSSYIPAHGPSERKVIHTAIAEFEEVLSESIGNGYFKRIRIKLVPELRAKYPNSRNNSNNNNYKNDRNSGDRNNNKRRNNNNRSNGNRNFKSKNDNFGNRAPRNHDLEANGNAVMATEKIPENLGNQVLASESNSIDENIGNQS